MQELKEPETVVSKAQTPEKIRSLLQKTHWQEEEYQSLKAFLLVTPEEVEEALAAVDIEELLAGLGYRFPHGLAHPQIRCFMHPDNRPSLTLYRRGSPARYPNTCYCFGCRQSLNPASVLTRFYGKSYPEALDYLLGDCLLSPRQLLRREIRERLAKKHSGKTEAEKKVTSFPSLIQEIKPKEKEVEPAESANSYLPDDPQIQVLLKVAVEFYRLQLLNYPPALAYLLKRGLSSETIEKYRLGYASGFGLANWLSQHRLDLSVARQLGLLGEGLSERLAGRIILPASIPCPSSTVPEEHKVLFLAGRLLPKEYSESALKGVKVSFRADTTQLPPKYLGLRLPKPVSASLEALLSILQKLSREERYILGVEGPFDWLVARQWGYPALCFYGISPGSLALEQLKQALMGGRLARLYLCLDNDPPEICPDGSLRPGPGQRAAHSLALQLGVNKVGQVSLPPGFKDLASLAQIPDGQLLFARSYHTAVTTLFV
ncbi:MAG TPA: hypothetical protein VH186_25280 [Chloroflexia bacterium]|nr:hypothetical protein [Chloroflexia bacterium]